MRMRARRNFYANGRIEGPRRIILRNETFETDAEHARQLEQRRLAVRAETYQTQTITPETPQDNPADFLIEPVREPQETPQAAPDLTKAQILEETPGEDSGELEGMEYNELKRLAKDAGVKGYNRMRKADLIKNLKGGK